MFHLLYSESSNMRAQDAVIRVRPPSRDGQVHEVSNTRPTQVAFGERVTEPPNLNAFVASLKKAAEKSKLKAQQTEQMAKGPKLTLLQRQFV